MPSKTLAPEEAEACGLGIVLDVSSMLAMQAIEETNGRQTG